MRVEQLTRVDEALLEAVGRLIPQLTSNHPPPDAAALQALLAAPGSLLLAVREREGGRIEGLLTLVLYRVPTGVRARIEDVVVDEAARGRGLGRALVEEALRLAQEAGANGVALTSNPRRAAANRLYQKMGFRPWRTNLYFYPFAD